MAARTDPSADPGGTSYSQTLDRGLRALEILAAAEQPLSIQQVAERLDVHRSVAYRVLRTLEAHRLVERDERVRYAPGLGLAALGRTVRQTLQSAVLPELSVLAEELGMTAFLVVPDRDEAVTVASVEPRHSHVAYRPGIRHAIDRGAPGIALLAAGSPRRGERREVAAARSRGWATSFEEVLRGMRSVAVPLVPDGRAVGAIAVVYVDASTDAARVGRRLVRGARRIEAGLT